MHFQKLVAGLAFISLLVSCGVGGHIQNGAKNTTLPPPPSPLPEIFTTVTENPYFLQISDVHFNAQAITTNYGDDTGTKLWAKTKVKLTEIIQQKPAPTFIIYTGDLPAHYDCDKTCFIPPDQRTTHRNNIATLLADLRQLVEGTGIPLLFVPGNNDSLAGDYYSFADSTDETILNLAADPENPYPALNSSQTCGKTPCIVSNPDPQMGYFSARPIDGLRVIVLNSVVFGQRYYQVDGVEQVDAGTTQMSWLQTELAAASLSREKVYILMHIPPGTNAYAVAHNKTPTQMWAELPMPDNTWLHQFLRLMEQYQSEITGIVYGHTHMDEVRRLYTLDGTCITEVAVSAPGVTPQHKNNPGIKIYRYDSTSKELLNFETYYTTPTAPSWGSKSYTFSTIFQCDANNTMFQCLSEASLTDINTAMDTIFTVKNGAPSYATISGIEVTAK